MTKAAKKRAGSTRGVIILNDEEGTSSSLKRRASRRLRSDEPVADKPSSNSRKGKKLKDVELKSSLPSPSV